MLGHCSPTKKYGLQYSLRHLSCRPQEPATLRLPLQNLTYVFKCSFHFAFHFHQAFNFFNGTQKFLTKSGLQYLLCESFPITFSDFLKLVPDIVESMLCDEVFNKYFGVLKSQVKLFLSLSNLWSL